ncbi:MAG TPA: minor capsid protein [Mobilitalea sp.]|nr:minor capsid protein [Mobilitalea sp.]
MEFNGRLDIKSTDLMLKGRGLQDHGPVQKVIDQEVIRLMAPYTPRQNNILIDSATLGTDIGNGEINQNTPYARYHYYGKLMVSSITGSAWASRGEKKILTDVDMKYNGAPMRGPFWFERMKADKKDQILRAARKAAGANEHN